MSNAEVKEYLAKSYQPGFVTDIESDAFPPGLTEEVVRAISAKKNEPEFLLKCRLNAYRHWLTMQPPTWAYVRYDPIDFNVLFTILRLKVKKTALKVLKKSILNYYELIKN